MSKKMNVFLKEVLNKMCNVVGISGINFNNFDFKEDNWYQKYQWTEVQEKEFIEWMKEYLMKSSEARKAFMARPSKSKRDIERVVYEFVGNYGWATKLSYETDEI